MSISIQTKYIASSHPSQPAMALQITQLVDSYMLWIGTTECAPEDVDNAILTGCLGKDWACAMPGAKNTGAVGTSLFRSSGSDVSLSMAQRLATRLKKQVFLSIDVPETMVITAERGIVEALKKM